MNDRLREILPLLRPRSAEPTLFSQVVWYSICTGLALLAGLYFLHWLRLSRQRRQEFVAAASVAGLKRAQTELLLRVASRLRLNRPHRLLASAHAFDRQVGRYAGQLARRDRHHPELAAIAAIRTVLGFDQVPAGQALSSTRQVQRGQTVMVWQEAGPSSTEGFAPWLVLERDEAALFLAPLLRPGSGAGPGAEVAFVPGDEISVRFWREGDTEYRFTSAVLAREPKSSAVLVEHTAAVERLQQRDFYRIDVDFPVRLFALAKGLGPEEAASAAVADAALTLLDADRDDGAAAEQSSGSPPADAAAAIRVSGRVRNLSAGGLAVTTPESGPLPARATWFVDPAFEGPFPLSGLACSLVADEAGTGDRILKLRFEALPATVEKEIVRGIYQHQILGSSTTDPGGDVQGTGQQPAGRPGERQT